MLGLFSLGLKLDHIQIRRMVVERLPPMIGSKQIDWDPFSSLYESPQQWMTKMKKNGEPVDDAFIQLTTMIFSKTIKIVNVIGAGSSLIEFRQEPPTVYLLYFQEVHFDQGCHYQSIRPIVYAQKSVAPPQEQDDDHEFVRPATQSNGQSDTESTVYGPRGRGRGRGRRPGNSKAQTNNISLSGLSDIEEPIMTSTGIPQSDGQSDAESTVYGPRSHGRGRGRRHGNSKVQTNNISLSGLSDIEEPIMTSTGILQSNGQSDA